MARGIATGLRVAAVSVFTIGVDAGAAGARTFTASCSGTAGNVASLASAITQANSLGGSNTIQLGAGCIYSLTTINNYWYGPNGLPPIASTLTIDGNGAVIGRDSGAPKFRLLYVGADPTSTGTQGYTSPGAGKLTLKDLTLSDGYAQGGSSNGGGGGAGMGGAIFNQGAVTIIDSTLTANTARGGSAIDATAGTGGGGIGTSSSGVDGGGFGPGSFGGASGGAATTFGINNEGGGGGGGFVDSESGQAADDVGAGGGSATGLGGAGGDAAISPTGASPAGDGSGSGGAEGVSGQALLGQGKGGDFGAGGVGAPSASHVGGGGGGVGGGGGAGGESSTNNQGAGAGGGGFGAGGGATANGGDGGKGGFGGGGGGGTGHIDGNSGPSGFGGGYGNFGKGGGGAGMGGAIFNMQGAVTLVDATVAGNHAIGGADNVPDSGKGIAGAVFNLSGTLTASGSTFAENSATTSASQIYNLVYDAGRARNAVTALRSTIVSGGIGTHDLASANASYITPSPDIGTATADVSKFDLVSSMGAELQGKITGSPLTADPRLGPLQNNGGPTQTMAPALGSPAIEAGNALGQAIDQRGSPRTVDFPGLPNRAGGDGSDIGAVELQRACVGQSAPSQPCHVLTLAVSGRGKGRLTAPSLSCPLSCTGRFAAGMNVVVVAKAARGSLFAGWAGACHGAGGCVVRMDRDQRVSASFSKLPAPTISHLRQSHARWRRGSKHARLTARAKAPPVGTTFSFTLNEGARVTLTFASSRGGRRVRAGAVKLRGHRGQNRVAFFGRLAGHKRLKPGRYTLVVAAVNVLGRHGKSRPLHFVVLAG